VTLPTGRYAYGRVLRDASVAFYRTTTTEPGLPPIGTRDYQFVVGVYDDVPGWDGAPVVGHDPSQGPEDDWPPPHSVRDPISGAMSIYHHGHMRPATPEETEGLEPAAVWDLHHLIDRLTGSRSAKYWFGGELAARHTPSRAGSGAGTTPVQKPDYQLGKLNGVSLVPA
jgi:hypothetical protein